MKLKIEAIFVVRKQSCKPGDANALQDLSFTEIKIIVVAKQDGQIWLSYSQLKNELAANRKSSDVDQHCRSNLVFE